MVKIDRPHMPGYGLQLMQAMAWRERDFPTTATCWRFENYPMEED